MTGAIIGAVTGIMLPFISLGDDSNGGFAIFFSPILGLMGGMGGAAVGSMFGHDVWQAVDLSPSTVERRRRLSYRLSFRF